MDTTYFRARIEGSSRTWPVRSWKQVSEAYLRAIQACGLAAPTPACHILDEAGQVFAFVSLSGRVFEGSGGPMSGMKLGTRCLFDPLNPRS